MKRGGFESIRELVQSRRLMKVLYLAGHFLLVGAGISSVPRVLQTRGVVGLGVSQLLAFLIEHFLEAGECKATRLLNCWCRIPGSI